MVTETTNTTEVGSYFVSNYPPFSLWKPEWVPDALERFREPPRYPQQPLGLYVHIPFCRKRCRFCYFRVYTSQNANAIEDYVQALIRETEIVSHMAGIGGRDLQFVYFGGGTPSHLSSRQLLALRDRMSQFISWDNAQEVTFECEPGTLSQEKVNTLKEIGVTRVSLGVQNFDDQILEENGRAHLSPEIGKAYDWIQNTGFAQVNIDLIAGMVGETEDNWNRCIDRALAMQPDNITVYQMELPHNTIISREMKDSGSSAPVANWATKRAWVSHAMDRLLESGYHISSGNELVRNPETDRFIYRDSVWRGCDLLATGVSSFGHFQGMHYQNLDNIECYISELAEGRLPINRALEPTPRQLLIRELVLLLKEGHLDTARLSEKHGVDVLQEFAEPFQNQQAAGYLQVHSTGVKLTRKGLLQVDSLLPEYFEAAHRQVRYT